MTTPSTSPSSLKVLRSLGSDEMSEAYLAAVPGFEAPLVVRALRPEVAADEAKASRFIESARSLIPVAHPSLVRIHSAGRMQDGRVYALSDFVDADTLQSRGTVPVPPLVELGLSLCDALEAVHQAGLSLGTLSPRHVFLPDTHVLLDPLGALVGLPASPAPALDVRSLAVMLQAAAAPGEDKYTFDTAIRESLTHATTAQDLKKTLESLRASWNGETTVSSERAAAAPSEEPDLSGAQLGQWKLEHLVGEGAMGRVYLGRHARIGRQAAIKVLKAEHAGQAELVRRFIAEATAVNAIKNPHIVEVFDFGEERRGDGPPLVFCVMELLDGVSLSQAIFDAPFDVARAAKVGRQLAQALAAAHEVGVVHRDVKPENVFLHRRDGDRDYVKVLDFGVAKLVKPIEGLSISGTLAGVVIGTPEYMAPEQALGSPTDARADLYAVGLVLYEMLSGKQPFLADTFGKLVVAITTQQPPPLPVRGPSGEFIPARLAAVVMKCLEKYPEARYQTGAELAAALEPFTLPGGVDFEPSPGGTSVPLDAEVVEAAVTRSRAPLVGVVAALLVLLGGGGYWLTRPMEPPPAPPAPTPVVEKVEPPAPPPEPPKRLVTLQVVSEPSGARVVRADTGAALGVTPLSIAVEAQAVAVPLRVELDGYRPASQDVAFEGEPRIDVKLTRLEAPTKVASPPGKGKVKKKVSRDATMDPFGQ